MLKSNEYRDNNNYLRKNKIGTKETTFVDMLVKPHWVGFTSRMQRNITFDGVNYQLENVDRLFATFYFLSTE